MEINFNPKSESFKVAEIVANIRSQVRNRYINSNSILSNNIPPVSVSDEALDALAIPSIYDTLVEHSAKTIRDTVKEDDENFTISFKENTGNIILLKDDVRFRDILNGIYNDIIQHYKKVLNLSTYYYYHNEKELLNEIHKLWLFDKRITPTLFLITLIELDRDGLEVVGSK
jgi:hypothetical protein